MREFKEIALKYGLHTHEVERIFRLQFSFVYDVITKGDQDQIMLKNFGTFTTNARAKNYKKLSDFESEEEFKKYINNERRNKRLLQLSKKEGKSSE